MVHAPVRQPSANLDLRPVTPPRGIRLPGWPPPQAPVRESPPAPSPAPAPKAEPPPLVLEQEAAVCVIQVTLWGDELLGYHKEHPGHQIVMLVYDKKHPAKYVCTVNTRAKISD